MANATDSNFWRSPDTSNADRQSPTSETQIVSTSNFNSSFPALDAGHASQPAPVDCLAAVASALSKRNDRVVWNLAASSTTRVVGGDQLVRVDSQHAPVVAPRQSLGLSDEPTVADPWLIVVEDARRWFEMREVSAAWQRGAEPLLLVLCEQPASVTISAERLAESAAAEGWHYFGPIVAESAAIDQAIGTIQSSGHTTILHVRPPAEPRQPPRLAPAIGRLGSSLGAIRPVHEALARLAIADERIVAVGTHLPGPAEQIWQSAAGRILDAAAGLPDALQWCVQAATSGSRPFVFLSAAELQAHWSQIREQICEPGSGVTLVVEGHASTDRDALSPLGIYRHLPGAVVVSPIDAIELDSMLLWCAEREAPVVVWLPSAELAPSSAKRAGSLPIGTERLRSGSDVLIISWGELTGAALEAADRLSDLGVSATLLHCSRLVPLDLPAICQAARLVNCVVLIDESARGGLSGWILEELAHQSIASPVSVIAAPANGAFSDGGQRRQALVLDIVERCRWLAEPVSAVEDVAGHAPTPAVHNTTHSSGHWSMFFGQHAEQMALERQQVLSQPLSTDVHRWVSAYEAVGSRDLYLWKWCRHGAELTTLPSVLPELRAHVCDTKVLSIVLCVLLDDVADQHGNNQLLEALLEMTCSGTCRSWPRLNAAEKRHAQLARALWVEYQQRVAEYPRHEEFAPVLRYDLLQFFNTMRYSHLVNGRPYLLNMVEHDLYTSHNMMMISFATLDLMCSPDFPLAEVGALREMMWHAQNMGRIGNLLSTWRRELAERDYTSGVFARALTAGDVTLPQLQKAAPEAIESLIRNRGHLGHFFRKWQAHRDACHARAADVHSLDLRVVLDGHDRFFAMHLGSQGLI